MQKFISKKKKETVWNKKVFISETDWVVRKTSNKRVGCVWKVVMHGLFMKQ